MEMPGKKKFKNLVFYLGEMSELKIELGGEGHKKYLGRPVFFLTPLSCTNYVCADFLN